MKYRFYGDTLQLIKYELSIKNDDTSQIMTAVTEQEKADLLSHYPQAIISEIDNTGYEWLDGMVFTQEQLRNGELESIIEMGEAAYNEKLNMPSQEEINAMLMLQIAELKAGVDNE